MITVQVESYRPCAVLQVVPMWIKNFPEPNPGKREST